MSPSEAILPYPLSPSRASDFKTCPQLFKFPLVDRLPEAPSIVALRGTTVHLVLQRLFDRPAAERTIETALDLLDPAWCEVVGTHDPEVLFGAEADAEATHRAQTERFVRNYFTLEDPGRLEPVGRELRLSAEIDGLRIVGILDRLDRHADGTWVVADYKTGGTPDVERALPRFFGLQVYALLVHALTGDTPARLRLLYLDTPDAYVVEPGERDVLHTGRLLAALGRAIRTAYARGDWRARPGVFCNYCSFREICPAWGGTGTPADAAPTLDLVLK